MAKKIKLQFKDSNGSFRNLDKFPITYNFIRHNWSIIRKSYVEKNSDTKKIFANVPELTCSAERFKELQLDLKVKTSPIEFYYENSRICTLSAKKDEETNA